MDFVAGFQRRYIDFNPSGFNKILQQTTALFTAICGFNSFRH